MSENRAQIIASLTASDGDFPLSKQSDGHDGQLRVFAIGPQTPQEVRQAQGVSKGNRVAIGMCNYPEWPTAFFACHAIGAVAVTLNAWWIGVPSGKVLKQELKQRYAG